MKKLFLICSLMLLTSFAKAESCPTSHCGAIDAQVKETCERNGWGAGNSQWVVFEGKTCQCGCSCVTGDTLISLMDGHYAPIANLEPEDSLLLPFAKKLTSNSGTLMSSRFQTPTTILETSFSNGASIYSSENHTFITDDYKVVKAKNLKKGMKVMGDLGTAVTVLMDPISVDFLGQLFNLSLNKTSSKAIDHVIVTNGIYSGDWLLQNTSDAIEDEIDVRTANNIITVE
ncbi:MAG: hypothetical protein KDD35_08770 [Bdellovibrionales bacterium]|nr:hypothetical protein [Bdellovibrionales bacterium]